MKLSLFQVEDLERWLDRVEGELSSEDHGKDLISVENLMKKLDAVEAEIQGRGDNVTDVMAKARDLKNKVMLKPYCPENLCSYVCIN